MLRRDQFMRSRERRYARFGVRGSAPPTVEMRSESDRPAAIAAATNVSPCLMRDVKDYAVFSFGEDGRALSCNAGVTVIFGFSPCEFVGMAVDSLFATDERGRARHRALRARARKTGRVRYRQWMGRKDGSRFYAHWSLMWVAAPAVLSARFAAIVRDGTRAREQARVQAALLATERREHRLARERTETIERFLSVLSHELRSPLSAVVGWSRLIADGADAEVRQRAFKAIQRNALALSHVVNDLMDQERIASGKMILARELLDVREVCLSAIETVEPAARAKDLILSSRIGAALPRIKADPARLGQVLWNLLSNAVKFTPHGGRISLHVEEGTGTVRIVVADTGRGISADSMPHLFVRHFQGEQGAGRQDGLGLGLALVHEIVARHGGHVQATSPGEDMGATFIVELPSSPDD